MKATAKERRKKPTANQKKTYWKEGDNKRKNERNKEILRPIYKKEGDYWEKKERMAV